MVEPLTIVKCVATCISLDCTFSLDVDIGCTCIGLSVAAGAFSRSHIGSGIRPLRTHTRTWFCRMWMLNFGSLALAVE